MRLRFLNPPVGDLETVSWKDSEGDPLIQKQVRTLLFSIVDETNLNEEGEPTPVFGTQRLRVDPSLTGPQVRAEVLGRAQALVATIPPPRNATVDIDLP